MYVCVCVCMYVCVCVCMHTCVYTMLVIIVRYSSPICLSSFHVFTLWACSAVSSLTIIVLFLVTPGYHGVIHTWPVCYCACVWMQQN